MSDTREALEPCPLCGGAMSVRTNRDWHRLVGEHAENCLMHGFEPYYAATPKDREALVAAWNRRAALAATGAVEREPESDMVALLRDPKFRMSGGSQFALEIVSALSTVKQTPYGPAIRGDVLMDAERYRWLRDSPMDKIGYRQADTLYLKHLHGADLDAAIDAAIASQQEQP